MLAQRDHMLHMEAVREFRAETSATQKRLRELLTTGHEESALIANRVGMAEARLAHKPASMPAGFLVSRSFALLPNDAWQTALATQAIGQLPFAQVRILSEMHNGAVAFNDFEAQAREPWVGVSAFGDPENLTDDELRQALQVLRVVFADRHSLTMLARSFPVHADATHDLWARADDWREPAPGQPSQRLANCNAVRALLPARPEGEQLQLQHIERRIAVLFEHLLDGSECRCADQPFDLPAEHRLGLQTGQLEGVLADVADAALAGCRGNERAVGLDVAGNVNRLAITGGQVQPGHLPTWSSAPVVTGIPICTNLRRRRVRGLQPPTQRLRHDQQVPEGKGVATQAGDHLHHHSAAVAKCADSR